MHRGWTGVVDVPGGVGVVGGGGGFFSHVEK